MNVTGARLKELRKARGYSQADVAKLLGVGRTTYLKYENGENKPTRQLEALSNLFGVSTDYILGQTDIPEPLPPYINKNLTPEQLAKFKADIASLTKGGKFDWSLIGPPVPVDDDTPQDSPHDTPQASPQGIRIPPNPSEKSENDTALVPLDADEREYIRQYRTLTDEHRTILRNTLKTMYDMDAGTGEDSAKDGAS